MLFLLQINQPGAPWWAMIMLGLLTVASGALNVVQARWKTAAEAAASELAVLRESRERLVTENQDKAKRIGELEGRTNLDSVRAQLTEVEKQIARESSEVQIKILGVIQSTNKDIMEGFAKHGADDREFQKQMMGQFSQITAVLTGIEQRLNDFPKAA